MTQCLPTGSDLTGIERMSEKPVLASEIEFFEDQLPSLLLEHAGKVVVISAAKVVGVFPTYEKALAVGAVKFGRRPFLVRYILPTQPDLGLPAMALALLAQPGPSSR